MDKKKSENVILVLGIIVCIVLMAIQKMNTVNALNGLIAQLQNIVIVLLTVKAHKKGFIASVVINIISCLSSLSGVILSHQMGALPGIIIPLVTILMAYFIYSYSSKMQKANDALSVTIDELNKANDTLVAKDKKLMHLAYYDILTGLANKQKLMDTLDEKIARGKQNPFTVIEASIDNLKEITDTYGLNTADEIIFSYASKVKNVCGNTNFVSRLDTGRFVIIMDGQQSQDNVISLVSSINKVINEPVVVKDIAFKTTMSYGVVNFPDGAGTSERLIQCANSAIDYVNARGGNNVSFFSNSSSVYVNQ